MFTIQNIYFVTGIIVNIQLIMILRYVIPLIKDKWDKKNSGDSKQ